MWIPDYPSRQKQAVVKQQPQKNRLTTEKVSEISQEQDQLDFSQQQMVVDKKTKAWVDAQNKLNSQKGQSYNSEYIEDVYQTYPMQYARGQVPEPNRRGSEPDLLRKQDVVPQPTQALTEFVKTFC